MQHRGQGMRGLIDIKGGGISLPNLTGFLLLHTEEGRRGPPDEA